MPDEGAAAIKALHDQLYGPVLRAALRGDIPYVSHITVAARSSFEEGRPSLCHLLRGGVATSAHSRCLA